MTPLTSFRQHSRPVFTTIFALSLAATLLTPAAWTTRRACAADPVATAPTATRPASAPATPPTSATTSAPTTTSAPATPPIAPLTYGPIRVEEIARTLADGPIRAFVAKINLTDPRVDVLVTGPQPADPNDPPLTETHAQTTPVWLEQQGLILAINTHFFALLKQPRGPFRPDAPVNLVGPCVSEGRVVSGTREDYGPFPVLALTNDRQARIGLLTLDDLKDADDAVAGLAESSGKKGTLLVDAGKNTGATALVQPAKRHPRTAVGLTKNNQTLIFLVVDGRQPGWSIGVTLPELADLMLELGAYSAVALDGGGSSSFVFAPPNKPRVTNRPSDGHWRAVGASLGIRLRERD